MVKILEHRYESADDRSYGNFWVKAETRHGLLVGKALIQHDGSFEDEEWTLNGEGLSVSPDCVATDYGGHGRGEDYVDHTLKYLQSDLDAWEEEFLGER